MTTTEKNKLIAEFMGYTQPHPDYPNATYWYKEGEAPLTLLLYNTSWDWLMPVVEKIESLGYGVTIDSLYVKIQQTHIEFTEKTKIEAVYNAVVQFAKHYLFESEMELRLLIGKNKS